MKAWFARLSDVQVAEVITNDKVPVLFEEGPPPMLALEEIASAITGESAVFLSKELSFMSLTEIKAEGRHDEGDSVRGPVASQGQDGRRSDKDVDSIHCGESINI